MSKDNGGSAFPQPVEIVGRGMSLRDYFAAKAMAGLISGGYREGGSGTAKIAYEVADAMLKARGE